MAGMFYSLQEVAEKLNKSEDEIRQMVKDGKLREFRDGPNLLFKIDEVESLMSDTAMTEAQELTELSEAAPEQTSEEISLSETVEGLPEESELANADTIASKENADILDESETGTKITEDTQGETMAASGSSEASIEEIEEDINLDSFGTGSGLLDLSLQADDTSLGGILDEIYTPQQEAPKEPAATTSAMGAVAAEAEQILPEEKEIAEPQAALGAIAGVYAEAEPDAASKAIGAMLFIPILAVAYTAIVTIAGWRGIIPSVLEPIKSEFTALYLMGGLVVAALLIFGIGFAVCGGVATVEKEPRVKKVKQPKPKKEKKVKAKKEDKKQ